ncbi:MAG: helix-turn-helix transcriptional regulator, partial [Alphaproteobacteria bacterium]|nr:helix-turn-helix transcriptional regulator [Alphaproteobacteria bacterium]
MTRKFKRRELILAQASQLFMEKGFAATSLEDIAEAVGIRRESLYYYYPGKYDLLYDIIEPQIANVMTGFE